MIYKWKKYNTVIRLVTATYGSELFCASRNFVVNNLLKVEKRTMSSSDKAAEQLLEFKKSVKQVNPS
ncbi:unnamed protein product [Callosobruchus maculatus]|uniref:Uncharacterized protein n=1 Tax=Callosobruchus maculatus TaxID=64391 RepID=A0A653BWC2_CALMS|nr:unnamed protein product [Callosobruchus maculatus]